MFLNSKIDTDEYLLLYFKIMLLNFEVYIEVKPM